MIKKNRLTAIEQVNIAQVKKVGKAQGSVARRTHLAAKLAMGTGILSVGGYIGYKTGKFIQAEKVGRKIVQQALRNYK